MISLKILGGDFRYFVDERACARKDAGERCGVGSFAQHEGKGNCIIRRHQDDEQVQPQVAPFHLSATSLFRVPGRGSPGLIAGRNFSNRHDDASMATTRFGDKPYRVRHLVRSFETSQTGVIILTLVDYM